MHNEDLHNVVCLIKVIKSTGLRRGKFVECMRETKYAYKI
jgi:hypothetical protein